MNRKIATLIPLCLLALVCLAAFFGARHVLQLPFRPTNDALHQRGASFNLDFLIPGGLYLDEKITIGEVLKIRLKREQAFYEKWIQALFREIPVRYRYYANVFLFFFWSFLFMTFFRVFTFLGYGRALRASLLLGGVTYFFMPDLSVGSVDDALFLAIPALLILLRLVFIRRRRKREARLR